jgi:coenzyme PQQ precursor peptide PqqA
LTARDEIVIVATRIKPQEAVMAWNTPEIEEVTCGMEINMYFPAETEEDLF